MARTDGKPRHLLLFRIDVDSAPISLFIDRLKKVLMVKDSRFTLAQNYSFPGFSYGHKSHQFLDPNYFAKCFPTSRGNLLGKCQNQREISDQIEKADLNLVTDRLVLQISRYPLASKKNLILSKEEVDQKRIYLSKELKVVAI
jgi:hypothetical protein